MQDILYKSLIKITDRTNTEIDGVLGILAFDERYVKLDMDECAMVIEGDNLKIENMIKDTKKILMSGCVNALYFDKKSGKNKKLGK